MNISNDIPDTSLKFFRLLKEELLEKYKMKLDISRIENAEQPWAWAYHTMKAEKCEIVALKFKEEVKEKELKEEEITKAFIHSVFNYLKNETEYGLEDGRGLYERA